MIRNTDIIRALTKTMKEVRARVWENLEETIIQCLELPEIKSTKPTKSEAVQDIQSQLQSWKDQHLPDEDINVTFIESSNIVIKSKKITA